MPEALTWAFDAVALGIVAWTIELGFGASDGEQGPSQVYRVTY